MHRKEAGLQRRTRALGAQNPMRLSALLVTAILLGSPVAAQEQESSSAPGTSSPRADVLNLPVSLDRIRDALARPPAEPLKGINEAKTQFRIEIQERQKFEDLIANLKFESGPVIPGGRAMFEQQQRLFPSVDHPLVQPYAAFTQGELMQVLVTSLMERYFADRVVHSITAAERSRAEAAARAEVNRAVQEYCAAQPQGGYGIRICMSPDTR